MLIDDSYTLEEILKSTKTELKRAVVDKKHPFRYLVLSTAGKYVRSRYVVLREIDSSGQLLFYTDHRSEKIKDIRANDQVSLLFYHPKKQVQVIMSGTSEIHTNDELTKSHWTKVQGNAQRAYNTVEAPGEEVSSPEQGNLWKEEMDDEHFAVIKIDPTNIEVLQLNRSEHVRASFAKGNDWKGKWLVP